MTVPKNDRLLLVLPLQAYFSDGRIFIDHQACDGLRLWLENFDEVTLACVVYNAAPPIDRSPIDQIIGAERLKFVSLPAAYTPYRFLVSLPSVMLTLTEHIMSSRYLHFAIGGLWGDWASVASLLSARAHRPFAVWTDRVESQVVAFQAQSKRGFRWAYTKLTAILMRYYEREVIRLSAIGLFHGMDCYSSYSRYCKNPHLVHDIHLEQRDQISESELKTRLKRSGPIRIAYAGRVHKEKGVFDWIEALALAKSANIKFSAVWFGDGPELSTARDTVTRLGLENCVQFPGSKNDHSELIQELKTFDAFVFCHRTPESPRCLIEALICGLPLIGYDSDYQRDLISVNKGGLLTEMNNPALVAKSIAVFLSHRDVLTYAARRDGGAFTASEVFRHRSALTKSI